MNAIVLHEPGGSGALRFETVADPAPGAGEAVVRVRAAALNHRDLFICKGQYAGVRFPIILGSDGAGDVVELGTGVTDVRRGDRVVINPSLDWGDDPRAQGPRWRILGLPENGTFAELVKVPAANVLPRPPHLSDEEAAALPLAGLTAYRAVVTRGRVQRGETVLVMGIGGGVATLALLIAKQAGARVLVTSGSDAKLERARALGADGGFNYKTADWVREVRGAAGGTGPDLIIDGAGGATFDRALDAVRPGGRIVSYGATTGTAPEVAVRRIFWKQLNVLGSTMGTPDDFRGMLSLFSAAELHPIVDQAFPLAEVGRAFQRMDEATQFGKIVLRVG
ncbi:MAG TPA: zinc-binding dehydrogenase [bacterium]|nr:zinc-binding dehydrogenase [bacterium]